MMCHTSETRSASTICYEMSEVMYNTCGLSCQCSVLATFSYCLHSFLFSAGVLVMEIQLSSTLSSVT